MLSSQQRYQAALAALEAGKFRDAEGHFREFLKSSPNHVGALNLLTIALMRQERFAEAEHVIVRALELNKSSDVSFYNYGLILKSLNRPEDALRQFDTALTMNPAVRDTWNNRGTIFNQLGQYENAIGDFDKAISIDRNYSGAYCNKGIALAALKRFDEALAAYDRALALKPRTVEAHIGRARIFNHLKRGDDALAEYDKALALKPDLAEAHFQRGSLFAQSRRFAEALAAYGQALTLKPDFAEAHLYVGSVYLQAHRFDEAFAAYQKALALKPDLVDAHLYIGGIFLRFQRFDEAFAAYDKVIALKPDLAEAYIGRAQSRMSQGQTADAKRDYEQALALGADKEAIEYDLARFGHAETLPATPKAIVTDLFDDYADHFDEHLVEQLKYDIPAKIAALVRRHMPPGPFDVLDLGCGTGLIGVQFASMARTLDGVDLSQQMLGRAKQRGMYGDLVCADVAEFLRTHSKTYDVVIAADVFVYIGDLSRVFEGVGRILRSQGAFSFSVEGTGEGGYVLGKTGRYKHSNGYLRQLAETYGFAVETIEPTVIRKEMGADVDGFLALMRRP